MSAEMFVDEFKAALSAAAYFIPGVLLSCCAYALPFAAIFGGAALSPGASRSPSPAFPIAFLLGELGFFVFFGLGMTFFVIGTVPSPVAVAQFARTGEIGAGYRFHEIWRILRTNLAGYVLAWTVCLGLASITYISVFLAYATVVLCFVLPFLLAPITFYLSLLYAVVFGMAYREGIANVGLESAG